MRWLARGSVPISAPKMEPSMYNDKHGDCGRDQKFDDA